MILGNSTSHWVAQGAPKGKTYTTAQEVAADIRQGEIPMLDEQVHVERVVLPNPEQAAWDKKMATRLGFGGMATAIVGLNGMALCRDSALATGLVGAASLLGVTAAVIGLGLQMQAQPYVSDAGSIRFSGGHDGIPSRLYFDPQKLDSAPVAEPHSRIAMLE